MLRKRLCQTFLISTCLSFGLLWLVHTPDTPSVAETIEIKIHEDPDTDGIG